MRTRPWLLLRSPAPASPAGVHASADSVPHAPVSSDRHFDGPRHGPPDPPISGSWSPWAQTLSPTALDSDLPDQLHHLVPKLHRIRPFPDRGRRGLKLFRQLLWTPTCPDQLHHLVPKLHRIRLPRSSHRDTSFTSVWKCPPTRGKITLCNRSARRRLDRGSAGSSLRRGKVGSPQNTRRPSGPSGELDEHDAHSV